MQLEQVIISGRLFIHFWNMLKFTLRLMPLLAGIGLLILSQACTGPLGFLRHSPERKARVGVSALENTAAEGDSARFHVIRDVSEGDLSVILSVTGDAAFGTDYALRPVDSVEATTVTATIPDGQNFINLALDAVDDVPAEADETVTLTLQAGAGYTVDAATGSATVRIPGNDFAVTTTNDEGEGSLRQAILNANALDGSDTSITFDTTAGPFATPRTIALASELPALTGKVTIDGYIEGRLWLPSGVTVSGGSQQRVFNVAPGAKVTISSLTIAGCLAGNGGGIANRGELVVKGVTFTGNVAVHDGGALANLGGTVTVINSTFANNTAGDSGGGLSNIGGKATVTNCTFSGNKAKNGGALFSSGTLLLRNTILANSDGGADCMVTGALDPASTNNLIEANDGCGKPIITADPILGTLGGYNGPTRTFPLGGGSPAINLGDNASAEDEHGDPLKWDQRGNGDPRFVGGITDIGAFERQALPSLTVDTFEDTELRACTRSGIADCSLRGAIILANAMSRGNVITFDPYVFAVPRTITLTRPLPELSTGMTIDSSGTAGVTVSGNGRFMVFKFVPGAEVRLINIDVDDIRSPKQIHHPPGRPERGP